MEQIDITMVVQAVIGLLAVIITSVVIPWIKSKITASQWSTFQTIAALAVATAEQIYKGDKRGQEKYEYCMEYLNTWCSQHGISFDEVSVQIAIESAVKKMHDEVSENG